MRRTFTVALTGVCLFLCSVVTVPAIPNLFEPVNLPPTGASPLPALKQRFVKVDLELLRLSREPGARLRLNFFPGQDFTAIVTHVTEPQPGAWLITGKLEDVIGTFSLGMSGDSVLINVRSMNGTLLQLRCVKDEVHEVAEIDPQAWPGCLTASDHLIVRPVAEVSKHATRSNSAEDPNVIDVLVVYTPTARSSAGGINGIRNIINVAVADSNIAYQESKANHLIRLVSAVEVNYAETDFNSDLRRLTDLDGVLDEVHALRDEHGADAVCLFVNNAASCGLAWQMNLLSPSFANWAFSVVHYACASPYFTLAHELGHNMGCHHDKANARSQPLSASSYGWRFRGTNNIEYRTIMAYEPGAQIPRFSNPDVSYMGTPSGDAAEANNAQTLRSSAPTVANFRPTVHHFDVADAVDNRGFVWQISNWAAQTNITHDGMDAAASGSTAHSQSSMLSTTIQGPGRLAFWWKVSSEKDYDFLVLRTNGNNSAWISGITGWNQVVRQIPAGSHNLAWIYQKDAAGSSGEDKGWLDTIVYTTAPGRLTNWMDGPDLHLSFEARRGASYSLQISSDLATWVPLTNWVPGTSGALIHKQTLQTGPHFFRATSP